VKNKKGLDAETAAGPETEKFLKTQRNLWEKGREIMGELAA